MGLRLASFDRHGCGGQGEVEARARRRVGGCPQAATVPFDDCSADSEPKADAVRLGREEGIENRKSCLIERPDTLAERYPSHALTLDLPLGIAFFKSAR
jgi:hypothetical protein